MRMRPLTILGSDAATGCRIGGNGPAGQEQELRGDCRQYFGTFPLTDGADAEFSIFHRFDPSGRDAARDLIDFNNRVLEPGEMIWATIHAPSTRAAGAPAEFGGRSVRVEPDAADDVDDGCGGTMRYSGSKVGGRCLVERHQVADAVRLLEDEGYLHLLQICTPTDDLVDGFPWDPGTLNVWARDPRDATTYRFCVQQ